MTPYSTSLLHKVFTIIYVTNASENFQDSDSRDSIWTNIKGPVCFEETLYLLRSSLSQVREDLREDLLPAACPEVRPQQARCWAIYRIPGVKDTFTGYLNCYWQRRNKQTADKGDDVTTVLPMLAFFILFMSVAVQTSSISILDFEVLTYSSTGWARNSRAKTSRIFSPTHRPLVNVVNVK